MATDVRHSVSVAAVVVNNEGRILMTKRRDNGKWEPPGGVLETDESIIDGLGREVLEETGLHVAPDRLTGVYKNMPRGIIALVFRARITDGAEVGATSETTQLQWLTLDQVREHCDEAYAIRIMDALNEPGPAVSAHDGIRLIPGLASLPN